MLLMAEAASCFRYSRGLSPEWALRPICRITWWGPTRVSPRRAACKGVGTEMSSR
jgi:hypothetical protein